MHRRITTSSHLFRRGFTVVELLIVIVILSILLAVAVDSVIGYQSHARDREREADVSVISQVIERYYRTHAVAVGATYPTSFIDDDDLVSIIDDLNATTAPQETSSSIIVASTAGAQTPTIDEYIYQALNVDDTLCTTEPCEKYKLFYRLEVSDDIIVQNSLRQQ